MKVCSFSCVTIDDSGICGNALFKRVRHVSSVNSKLLLKH